MTAPQDSPNELGPEPPYMYVVDAGLLAWLRECAREPMYSKGFGRAAEAIQALQQRAELAERRADCLLQIRVENDGPLWEGQIGNAPTMFGPAPLDALAAAVEKYMEGKV